MERCDTLARFEFAKKVVNYFHLIRNIPYSYNGENYLEAKQVVVMMLEEHEKNRTRLTDRELQILTVAIKCHKRYDDACPDVGWKLYETVVREVTDQLGFEIHEEDIKILCGPMKMGDKG